MTLESLERRLLDLERRVFGPGPAAPSPAPSSGAAATLDFLARSLGNAAGQRGDRVAPVLRRTQEIDRYLDPSFLEGEADGAGAGLDAESKADVIVSREADIRRAAEAADRLRTLQSVLDGDAFSSAAQLEPKMNELSRLQIDQAEREAELSDETLKLIGKYNDAIEAMSNSFVHFDLVLREAEERTKKKPGAD